MSEARPGQRDFLSVVSTAGVEMSLQPDRVPAIAVRAAMDLGCDGAAFQVLDEPVAHRTLESIGLTDGHGEGTSVAASMTDLVLQGGATVVARRHPGSGDVLLPQNGDVVASVASPIWVDGWIAAVLVGVARADTRVTAQTVSAFGLLTSQAGLTLDNAQRIEEGGRTAERLMQGDRLKTEFLTTISHEMRTPLTALTGSGATLEQAWTELDDEDRLELLAAMNANARILDGMLTNLLDYARLEAGELWVSFEPFDVSAMLRGVCEHVGERIGERQLRVEIEDGLLASGDVVLIRRIVSHLLRNAVEHTPSGTTISASCDRRDDVVVVEIADDGPGIAQEDLPFLGERFFRSGEVNTRPKGLGLGLALTLSILELHGSTLSVENGPDAGARFSFSLPWVPDPTTSPSAPEGAEDPVVYARHHGRA
jgi:signal transduction histidine kinase